MSDLCTIKFILLNGVIPSSSVPSSPFIVVPKVMSWRVHARPRLRATVLAREGGKCRPEILSLLWYVVWVTWFSQVHPLLGDSSEQVPYSSVYNAHVRFWPKL